MRASCVVSVSYTVNQRVVVTKMVVSLAGTFTSMHNFPRQNHEQTSASNHKCCFIPVKRINNVQMLHSRSHLAIDARNNQLIKEDLWIQDGREKETMQAHAPLSV